MRTKLFTNPAIAALTVLLCFSANAARTTLSLDGQWQIEDGKLPTDIPARFTHTVSVPGLAHLAKPAFAGVDQFISREHRPNSSVKKKRRPAGSPIIGRARWSRTGIISGIGKPFARRTPAPWRG